MHWRSSSGKRSFINISFETRRSRNLSSPASEDVCSVGLRWLRETTTDHGVVRVGGFRGAGGGMGAEKVTAGAVVAAEVAGAGSCVAAGADETAKVAEAGGCVAAGAVETARVAEAGGCVAMAVVPGLYEAVSVRWRRPASARLLSVVLLWALRALIRILNSLASLSTE